MPVHIISESVNENLWTVVGTAPTPLAMLMASFSIIF